MSVYRRFFVNSSDIVGSQVDLTCQYQHIAKVLRMSPSDKVMVCCGDGIEHLCIIDSITSTAITGTILDSQHSTSESRANVTLLVGMLKGDKMDLVVQKSVELGVNNIGIFDSRYTVSQVNDNKITRYTRIADEAVKQCDRAVKVDIQHVGNIQHIDFDSYDYVMLCYEREQEYSVARCIVDNHHAKNIAVIVGSEGGFDMSEVELLVSRGATVVTLGRRILRAETAPMYALSVIDSMYNEVDGDH